MTGAPKIGLALGGGGISGYSFHAGALGAIHDLTGWDPRTAEIVIGTSAGSSIAALLRGGVAVPELVERMLSIATDPSLMARLRRAAGRGQSLVGGIWFGPSSPGLMARELLRLHRIRPMNVVAGALPSGRVANDVLGEQASMLHDSWPDRPTWIPAVALDTGELTVFGRDGSYGPDGATTTVSFADAIAASCAIPGFFQPVSINGRRYVDGGVRSMVSVDLLAPLDLDLVVVLSPMSVSGLDLRSPFATGIRSWPSRQLRRELGVLRAAGIPAVVIEPDGTVARTLGVNPMDPTSVVPALTAAAASSSVELARPRHAVAVSLLRDAARRLPSPPDVPYPD